MFTKIENDEQYNEYCEFLWFLVSEGDEDNSIVKELIDVLYIFIKDYDDQFSLGTELTPPELISSFIEEHDLSLYQLSYELFIPVHHIEKVLNYEEYPSEKFIELFAEKFKIQSSALEKEYRLHNKNV